MRYFTRSRAGIVPEPMISENSPFQHYPPLPELWVADFKPTDTGLIDSRGDSIMRAPNPVGFGKDNEW